MKKTLQLTALAALAVAAVAGCGGGSSGGEAPADATASADVPESVKSSWPAMYGYLLVAIATSPEDREPAKVTGDIGPTSDVVEAEVRP